MKQQPTDHECQGQRLQWIRILALHPKALASPVSMNQVHGKMGKPVCFFLTVGFSQGRISIYNHFRFLHAWLRSCLSIIPCFSGADELGHDLEKRPCPHRWFISPLDLREIIISIATPQKLEKWDAWKIYEHKREP